MQSQLEQNAIAEAARRITDLQRGLLQSLKDKGPGLLLELAVRVYKFPEDVREPMRELKELGLAGTQSVSESQFGAELYLLTPAGDRALALLADPAFQREAAPPAAMTAAAPRVAAAEDPRQSEAELHKKLGDALQKSGDLQKAIEHYQKALELTRELSANLGGAG